MRGIIEYTVRSIRAPFGLISTPDSETHSAIPSNTILKQSLARMNASKQNPPPNRAAEASNSWNGKLSPEDQELIDENSVETRTVRYKNGPNRTVFVKDGDRDCVAFLLTEETVRLLSTMVQKRRKLDSRAQLYQEVSRAAKFGVGFLEYSETMLAEATSKEEYDQIKEDIDRQQPEILKNIERKEKLESERQAWEDDLDYSRSQVENIFEQILLNAQLMQDPQDDGWADSHEARNTALGDSEMQEERSTIRDQNPAEPHPLEEDRAARQRLLEAQIDFDSLQSVQEQKIIEYRQLEQEGRVQFSESELDLYHVQMGRDITRALIEAERTYSEAFAKVRGLGLLESGFDQESGLGDCTNDDCSAFVDPGAVAASFNPSFIEAWADDVYHSQEEDMMDIAPETDDWEARTVTMSDSVSVVATENDRKQIDRWRYVCEGGGSASDAVVSAVVFEGHIA